MGFGNKLDMHILRHSLPGGAVIDPFAAYAVGGTAPAFVFDAEAGRFGVAGGVPAEQQFANADFSDGLTGWSNDDDHWIFSGGAATHPPGTSFNKLMQAIPPALAGQTVHVRLVVAAYSGTAGLRLQWRRADGSGVPGASAIHSDVVAGADPAIAAPGVYERMVTVPEGAVQLAIARDRAGQSMDCALSEFSVFTSEAAFGALSLSDIPQTAEGGRYLDLTGSAMTAYTVAVDVVLDNDGNVPAGVIASLTSGYPGGNRIEVGLSAMTGGQYPRLYLAPGDPASDFVALPSGTFVSDGTASHLRGERIRLIFTVQSGARPRILVGNSELAQPGPAYATMSAPTRIGVGCRAWAATPGGNLEHGEVKRVIVWPGALSEGQMREYALRADAPPVHLLGDSFLNVHGVRSELRTLFEEGGTYIPVSQDHVGGSTLTQQAARFAAGPAHFRDATLVICDFGFDGTAAQGIAAIQSMLATLDHDRWIYMQPAPSTAQAGPVTAMPGKHQEMLDWMGAQHFVSTLAEAWAESDGSPEDQAKVALGQWPLSLVASDSDFHPNGAGRTFIARRIKAALEARGWA